MLEFDIGEGKAGRMTILARLLEICAVGRLVAAHAARLRLFLPVAGFARQLPVAAEQRKTRVGVLVEKRRSRGIGHVIHAGRRNLDRLGTAGFQEEG
jgi:hypothetical protein